MHLVIGGCGLIGTALRAELEARKIFYEATTRRGAEDWRGAGYRLPNGMWRFDLLRDAEPPMLPYIAPDGVVYLIAGMAGFKACQGNPESWIVNRDAPIALVRYYKHAFVVFLSSDAVDKDDWALSAYARQKTAVEAYINAIDGAIVRLGKVAPERAGEVAKVIVDVGLARRPGVTRWRA